MGIRLVRYGFDDTNTGTLNHNELINRDSENAHPISSITGLLDKFGEIGLEFEEVYQAIKDKVGIEKTIDSPSIKLNFDGQEKSLMAQVKIFPSDDNALVEKLSGLYVDKYLDVETQETDTMLLTTEGKGETLKTMYETGTKFSHYNSWSNMYNSTEANAWYYDESLQSFIQPQNTTTFTGFISTVQYRSYSHKAMLTSNDGDNDTIGLIIAYAVSEDNRPHTLSVLINRGAESHAGAFNYALVYDFMLPDQQVLYTKGNSEDGMGTIPAMDASGWSGKNITLKVDKAGSFVSCAASNFGSTNINTNTVISINLDDYVWGSLFRDKVRYGYCAISQATSYFKDIAFLGKGPIKGEIKISKDDGNIIEKRADGLFAFANANAGTIDHSELLNRDANDSHPMSAITGLEEFIGKINGLDNKRVNTELFYGYYGLQSNYIPVLNTPVPFKKKIGNITEENGFPVLEPGKSYEISLVVGYDQPGVQKEASIIYAIKAGNNTIGILNPYRGNLEYERGYSTTLIYKNTEEINTIIQVMPTTISVNDILSSTFTFITIKEVGRAIAVDPVEHVNASKGIEDSSVGSLLHVMGKKAPKHYLICDGALYDILEYPHLSNWIKEQFGSYNYFGGDGVFNFAVPKLDDDVIRAAGSKTQVGVHQDGTKLPYIGQSSNTGLTDFWIGSYISGNSNGFPLNIEDKKEDSKGIYIAQIGGYNRWHNTSEFQNVTTEFSIRPSNTGALACIKYEPTYFMSIKGLVEETTLWEGKKILQCSTSVITINDVTALSDDLFKYDKLEFYYSVYDSATGKDWLNKQDSFDTENLAIDTGGYEQILLRAGSSAYDFMVTVDVMANNSIRFRATKTNNFTATSANSIRVTKIVGVNYKSSSTGSSGSGDGTYDHSQLLNRNAADSHPISAITGLQEVVDKVATIEEGSTYTNVELDHVYGTLKNFYTPVLNGTVPFEKVNGNIDMKTGIVKLKPGRAYEFNCVMNYRNEGVNYAANIGYTLYANNVPVGLFNPYHSPTYTDWEGAFSFNCHYKNETDAEIECFIKVTTLNQTDRLNTSSTFSVKEIGRSIVASINEALEEKLEQINVSQKYLNTELEYAFCRLNTLYTPVETQCVPFEIRTGNIEVNSGIIKMKPKKSYEITIVMAYANPGSKVFANIHYELRIGTTPIAFFAPYREPSGNDYEQPYTLNIIYKNDLDIDVECGLYTLKVYTSDKINNGIATMTVKEVGRAITFDPVEYVNKQKGIEDTPVGSALLFTGTKAPSHYIECDGSICNIVDYPFLAQFFKDQYGKINYFGGDGVTTFALPDSRDEFIRGYHGNKTEKLSGEIGKHQDATVIPSLSSYSSNDTASDYWFGAYIPKSIFNVATNVDKVVRADSYGISVLKTGVNTGAAYKNQTTQYTARPTNIAFLVCIKYEPTYYMNVDLPDTMKDLKEQNDLLKQQINQLSTLIDSINKVVI